jgi:hypothetical protein
VTRVYFVQARESGRIRIGVSKDPEARLTNMRVGSPEPLSLMFSVDGSAQLEKDIQMKFAHLHVVGEWFEPRPELLDFLRELWRDVQAHRASYMGYDKAKFRQLLEQNGRTWKDQDYVDAAIYHSGRWGSDKYGATTCYRNIEAIKEYMPARKQQIMPEQLRDSLTPKELEVWNHVFSTT